jgi:hypothetical protein
VLPRGNFFRGRSGAGYDFPALQVPGALDRLVDDALARFGAAAGLQAARGRLILTAHSGGGAALMRILRHTDPDEVHAFDALYGDPAPLIAWARRRRGRADSALRVVFRAGEDTARASGAVAAALAGAGPAFRVEATRVAHGEIPRRFGWRLLADAAADLPGVTAGGAAPRRPAPSPTGPGAGSPRPAPSGGGPRLSTAALRQAWAEYRCAGNRMVPLQLLSHRTPVNPVAVDAFRALGTALAAAGYVARSTWVYNCRTIATTDTSRPPQASLHAYGLAVDVDPRWNPHRRNVSGPIRFSPAPTLEGRIADVKAGSAGTAFTPEQVAAVEALRTVDGLQVFTWGGRWAGSHDAMHFQIAVTPAELRRGLAGAPTAEQETCGAWEIEAPEPAWR